MYNKWKSKSKLKLTVSGFVATFSKPKQDTIF